MTSQDKALPFLLECGDPTAHRTPAERLEHALRTVLALTDGDAAVAMPPGGKSGERLVLYAGNSAPATLPAPARGSEVARALESDPSPVSCADLAEEAQFASDTCPGVEAGPALFVTVRQRSHSAGYLAVYRRRGRARFNNADTRSLVLLAASLANGLEVLRLASSVEKVALGDDLTQVYNARFMRAAFRRELKRASRFGQELSVVLVEVDQFAAWTEQYGEPRGNGLLREVASLLSHHVRSFDLLGRADAGRFMMVLPQTGGRGACEVAERVRAAIEARPFAPADAGEVTASLGVASFPREGSEPKALLAAAERALARAKEAGANVVQPPLDRAA